MIRAIHVVDDVVVSINKTNPPMLVVTANGRVDTAGWQHPALSRVEYVHPPADGIQDFGFAADAPDGIVEQVLTPITASHETVCPEWVKGARVKSATNAVEALISHD